jgi:hypothetical protein
MLLQPRAEAVEVKDVAAAQPLGRAKLLPADDAEIVPRRKFGLRGVGEPEGSIKRQDEGAHVVEVRDDGAVADEVGKAPAEGPHGGVHVAEDVDGEAVVDCDCDEEDHVGEHLRQVGNKVEVERNDRLGSPTAIACSVDEHDDVAHER